MVVKLLLHAGCGSALNKPPREYAAYREVRLDANKLVKPDIVASIVAMPMVDDQSYDAIYCGHTLEHLYAHEVRMALAEFNRVLKPNGKLEVRVPDLQSIGGRLALDQADHVLYQSSAGPITPLDMIYGHTLSLAAGNTFMGHKTGFTSGVLQRALQSAGFEDIKVERGDAHVAPELTARVVKGVADASQEPEAETVSELEVRPCVGEAAPL